jgi:hypothetical protein
MSSHDYYNNQYPPQQQGYGNPGEQGHQQQDHHQQGHQQQWQPPAGASHGYADQSYNQGFEQTRAYDYNSPPPPDYQQPYHQQGSYQAPHDQYPHNQNQYASPPHEAYQHNVDQYAVPRPEGYQHDASQYTSPPDNAYNQQGYPTQQPDYGYNDQTQRAYQPHPPPTQTQYGDFTSPAGHVPAYPSQGYPAGAPLDPNDPNATQDRGLMGALAGGAVGAYGGHKVNHGFLGAVGGAIAGSLAEDALKKKKKEKKEKKQRPGGVRRDSSSSSSSSSSSDDDKKKKKKYGLAAGGVAAGAGAYGVHQYQKQHHDNRGPAAPQMRGNFSGSSTSITLDRDYDLIASCANVHGERKLSSISLNQCLTNSGGHFAWYRGGNFGASARNVRLIENGKVLEAELGTGGGGWNRDHIRLDERISNNDGELIFLQ